MTFARRDVKLREIDVGRAVALGSTMYVRYFVKKVVAKSENEIQV